MKEAGMQHNKVSKQASAMKRSWPQKEHRPLTQLSSARLTPGTKHSALGLEGARAPAAARSPSPALVPGRRGKRGGKRMFVSGCGGTEGTGKVALMQRNAALRRWQRGGEGGSGRKGRQERGDMCGAALR
eukprot:365907-Chlamydomonas_euryale.AAC.19